QAPRRQLPDGDLSLRGGLLQERFRPRCRDLDPDARHGCGAQRLLRPADGEDGRRAVSTVDDVATHVPVSRPAAASRSLVGSRRQRRKRMTQLTWNIVGLAVFAVVVFPVFWMISTAFKPDDQIYKLTPTWVPLHPTIRHFADAIHRPFFWDAVKNSLIIVSVTVVLSMALAFLAAVALAKFRFTGRSLFIVLMIGIH